tara:strand:- start:3713 stop:4303 length:591 start_codon:yes stop_codon:yes gene_type:complete
MEKAHYIKSLGNFLSEYESDLNFITKFNCYKNNKLEIEKYLTKENGCFQKFINDFRVARNIQKDKVDVFLKELKLFVNSDDCDNVDEFAKEINKKQITHGKIMTSLCSKVLFLNNPYKIIPIDTLAKKSLNYKGNNYLQFSSHLKNFVRKNDSEIDDYLNSIKMYSLEIESKYDFDRIEIIRKNRFIDKLLWTQSY